MKYNGWVLTALGLVLLVIGAFYDTSVVAADGTTGGIINFGLVADRLVIILVSGFTFVSGILLIGFASIRDQVTVSANEQKPAVKPADPFAGQY